MTTRAAATTAVTLPTIAEGDETMHSDGVSEDISLPPPPPQQLTTLAAEAAPHHPTDRHRVQLPPRSSGSGGAAAVVEAGAAVVVTTEVDERRRDFQTARWQRRAVQGFTPPHAGTIGLFQHVAEIRTDLQWVAQRATFRQRHLPYLSWIEHEKERKRNAARPLCTYLLIAICTFLLLFSFFQSQWAFEKPSMNPFFGPKGDKLVQNGALSTIKIIEEDQWYRLVTAIVLHGGILHLLVNLMVIAYIGPALERVHGSFTVGLTFVTAGTAANLCSAVLSPFTTAVGASGGICAWLGLCLVDGILHWPFLQLVHRKGDVVTFPFRLVILYITLELVLLFLVGLLPWVDNFAHLGGIFFGVCMGTVLLKPMGGSKFLGYTPSPLRRSLYVALRAVAVSLALTLVVLNAVWLYHSQNLGDLPCRNCRYLSCAPIPMFQPYCDPCSYISEAYTSWTTADPTKLDIDLHCPYGEIAHFVTATVPSNRGDWINFCHEYCDI